MTTPTLTTKQIKVINSLGEVLNFGANLIQDAQIPSKQRPRKKSLLIMFAAAHNYSESIFCLLDQGRTNAAEALLRPIFETYINLAFIYIGRNEKNAVRFLLEESYSKKKIAQKVVEFIEKNPTVDTSFDIDDPDWEDHIKAMNKNIKNAQKIYPYRLKQMPDLKQRCKFIDNYTKAKTKKPLKHSMEYWYVTMYWFFSNISHLDAAGLNTFVNEDENGNTNINISGDVSSVERVGIVTYTMYYQFLREIVIRFKLLPLFELRRFKKNMKEFQLS